LSIHRKLIGNKQFTTYYLIDRLFSNLILNLIRKYRLQMVVRR
jgi:hypothetical protein